MRIGIVTTWMERGAAYVSRQYRNVLSKDNEVFIYARGGEQYAIGKADWDDETVTWGRKPRAMVPTMVDMEDFTRWVNTVRPDVVFFNEQNWWTPVVWCNSKGIVTGGYIDYYTGATVDLFACYDFLICNTKRHYSVFSWHAGCYYVPWGTDTSLFTPSTLERVRDDCVVFFHSAGYNPSRKGTDLVIKAFDQVHGDAHLIIHTQRPLVRLPSVYSALIGRLVRSQRLTMINDTVGAPGLYHKGDVYVYPSRLDGIGLTVPEALACGLPVIATDNPPMSEFVDDQCGCLVPVARVAPRRDGYYWPQCEVSIDALTSAMQRYVDNAAGLAEMKATARQHAISKLDWRHNSSGIPGVFLSALRKGPIRADEAQIRALEYDRKTTGLALTNPTVYNAGRVLRGALRRVADRLIPMWTALDTRSSHG